jgi:SAM-dependent methyltransferase
MDRRVIMKLENLAYTFFGNNLVIGSHIKKQLAFLKEIVPAELQYREMDDLGCGDGKVTVLLREMFHPVKLRGFDINHGLVKRARSRGIDAGTIDLDKHVPGGELAVLWGVLHHLRDYESCLRRVKESYPLVFIREPVRSGLISGLELGHPLKLKELTCLVNRHLSGAQVHFCDNSILVFYACPNYIQQEDAFSIPDHSSKTRELIVAGRY